LQPWRTAFDEIIACLGWTFDPSAFARAGEAGRPLELGGSFSAAETERHEGRGGVRERAFKKYPRMDHSWQVRAHTHAALVLHRATHFF
jgi:hypothetical protein